MFCASKESSFLSISLSDKSRWWTGISKDPSNIGERERFLAPSKYIMGYLGLSWLAAPLIIGEVVVFNEFPAWKTSGSGVVPELEFDVFLKAFYGGARFCP